MIFAATVLTIVPPPVPPPVLNVVDVVTFPDGTTTPAPAKQNAPPVELKQIRPSEELPVPKIELDPKLGPKPTDRRTTVMPTDKVALLPPDPITPTAPTPIAPTPVRVPTPIAASPAPRPAAAPVPVPNPIAIPNPEPVTVKATPFSPALVQPEAEPLSISGAKLKLKQAQALKPLSPLDFTTPGSPTPPPPNPSPITAAPSPRPITPTPSLVPAPTTPPQAAVTLRTPSPPPPVFVAPKTAPLTISRTQTPLPKVQVPRISATDLRLPEVQAATEIAAPTGAPTAPVAPSGVTSVAGGLPRGSGQSGAPPVSNGSNSGVSGSQSGGGLSSPGSNTPSSGGGGASAGGPTGILPRRPGGASVRQPFPRGDSNTILGRMDKTYDCSRLNRERDERCPAWDPIEGRNAQGAAGFEVPVPKGLPKLRNPIGTNPLPVCPPGTPGNQMGLSCLPSREGPGIPKP